MLHFAINLYLNELSLRGHENLPTKSQLAQLIKVTPTSFSRMSKNTVSGPTRKQLGIIIGEFRRRGFNTTPNDLLRWTEPATTTHQEPTTHA